MSGLSPQESFLLTLERDATLKAIRAPVADQLDDVQDVIQQFVDEPSRLLVDLGRHMGVVPGKKFRPMLLLLVAGLGGKRTQAAVRAGAMVELIHTATLIHDDSIDRSLVRRGLPTINALWNDKVSVILGDYLYTRAFSELVQKRDWVSVEVLSKTAHRMSLGIMLEIEQKDALDVSEDDYLLLISEKTASLFSAACEIGAGLSFSDEAYRDPFRAFGHELGMAYQITDDLFDFCGDVGALGKEIGNDLPEGKITLPIIRALPDGPEEIRSLIEKVLESRRISGEGWSRLTAHLEESGAFAYCRERAASYAESARARLDGFAPGPFRDALELSVDFATKRSH